MHTQSHWTLDKLISGGGQVHITKSQVCTLRMAAQPSGYALAQLDDYHRVDRSTFRWQPPLHLSLRAHTSVGDPAGTLGFGFWNDPFSVSLGQSGTARRLPTTPQAVWFFYGSPPNDLQLAPPIPGSGWKSAVLRSPRISPLFLAPAAFIALIATRIRPLRRAVMNAALRTVRAEERLLEFDLDKLHEYELVWEKTCVRFIVDGQQVMQTDITPQPPLGFVAWIDNQYAIASPEGGLRFGVVPTSQEQVLEISDLAIDGTPPSYGSDRAA